MFRHCPRRLPGKSKRFWMLSQTLLCFHVQYESNTVLKPCPALPCNQPREKLPVTVCWFLLQSKSHGALKHCCILQNKVTHCSGTLFSSSLSKVKYWSWSLSYFPIYSETVISNIALICTKIATRHCPWTEPCFPEQLRLKFLLSNPALCSQTMLYALKAWSMLSKPGLSTERSSIYCPLKSQSGSALETLLCGLLQIRSNIALERFPVFSYIQSQTCSRTLLYAPL